MNFQLKTLFILIIILFVFQTGKSQTCDWSLYNMNNTGLPIDYVNDIEVDYDGNLWIATYNGLFSYNGDTIWTTHDTSTGLSESNISILNVDYDGNIWGGAYTGAYRYKNNIWTMFNSQNTPLPGDDMIDIEPDRTGSGLWFTTGFRCKNQEV